MLLTRSSAQHIIAHCTDLRGRELVQTAVHGRLDVILLRIGRAQEQSKTCRTAYRLFTALYLLVSCAAAREPRPRDVGLPSGCAGDYLFTEREGSGRERKKARSKGRGGGSN